MHVHKPASALPLQKLLTSLLVISRKLKVARMHRIAVKPHLQLQRDAANWSPLDAFHQVLQASQAGTSITITKYAWFLWHDNRAAGMD